MKEKELKRLSRAELLELLLAQTRETERLQRRLEKAEAALEDRYLQIREAGDLASAVVRINGVMEAAQEAARQYLDNIVRMEEETSRRCQEMLEQARREAAQIRPQPPEPTPAPEQNDGGLLDEIYRLLGEKQ